MFARVVEVAKRLVMVAPSLNTLQVAFTDSGGGIGGETNINTLNAAFRMVEGNAELHSNLFVHVFNVWVKGSEAYLLGFVEEENGVRCEAKIISRAKTVFGIKYFEEHSPKRLIYTLTTDRCQLRVWHGPWQGRVSDIHVDSYGSGNLLLDIHGKQSEVAKYLDLIQKISPLKRKNERRDVMEWV